MIDGKLWSERAAERVGSDLIRERAWLSHVREFQPSLVEPAARYVLRLEKLGDYLTRRHRKRWNWLAEQNLIWSRPHLEKA